MSCGTKIVGRNWDYWEREELASALERDGEHSLAQKVKREECLSFFERIDAEEALNRQGLNSFDYREERCRCEEE
jgi:hypothetical protein